VYSVRYARLSSRYYPYEVLCNSAVFQTTPIDYSYITLFAYLAFVF